MNITKLNKLSIFPIIVLFLLFFFLHVLNNENINFNNVNINLSVLYLLMIPLLFLSSVLIFSLAELNVTGMILIFSSLVFSTGCFVITHFFFFWFFYELAILPLLFLIFYYSPYSERFIAGWYFLGYVLITSLPMLLILFNLSICNNTVNILLWENSPVILNFILFLCFIVKVPFPPFHVWLPIVHAEANTYVSVMLSGYIMKLGLIGIYRFNVNLLPFLNEYSNLIFFCSLVFFLNAMVELDSKRWLAFFSLGHIIVVLVGLLNLTWLTENVVFFYSLGHGISAAALFLLFFFLYNLCGSRNWLIFFKVNNTISGFYILGVILILVLASFPPSIQFFSEISILSVIVFKVIVLIPFCFYLFSGGLIPVVLIAVFLVRNNNFINFNINYFSIAVLLFFSVFCYIFSFFF